MIIRNATVNDVSAILSLINELAVFEKEPDAVEVNAQELLANGFGENPLFQTIVAEINDEIVGMALYYYRFSTWKGKTLHLEDLIVKQSHRGLGIGYELYKSQGGVRITPKGYKYLKKEGEREARGGVWTALQAISEILLNVLTIIFWSIL